MHQSEDRMRIDQNTGPFVSFHLHVSSDCIKWQHLKILTSRGCKPISAVKLWLRRWAGVRNIIAQGPTQSFQFIKFFFSHRGVGAVDIEVYHPYSWGGGVCSTVPSTKKTRDRNRSPRLKADFHFNQSACWFSWLWALYKQNQMATPGAGSGCETLGRVTREEMYRKGVWEIKILWSWSNTVKLNSDQDHCPNKRTALLFWQYLWMAEHYRTSKRQETKRQVFYYLLSMTDSG